MKIWIKIFPLLLAFPLSGCMGSSPNLKGYLIVGEATIVKVSNKLEVANNQGSVIPNTNIKIRHYRCDLIIKTKLHGLLAIKNQTNCDDQVIDRKVKIAVMDGEVVNISFYDQKLYFSY